MEDIELAEGKSTTTCTDCGFYLPARDSRIMDQLGKCTQPDGDAGWIPPTSPICARYTRHTPEQKRFVVRMIWVYFFIIAILPLALSIFLIQDGFAVVSSPPLMIALLLVYLITGPALVLFMLRKRIFRR